MKLPVYIALLIYLVHKPPNVLHPFFFFQNFEDLLKIQKLFGDNITISLQIIICILFYLADKNCFIFKYSEFIKVTLEE